MSSQTMPAFDPSLGLIFTAADQLIPLFKHGSIDTSLARQMALSAIDAYTPESRADYVNVARTIAFSMAALALLGHASAQDITMTEKMRAFGRANALNRSADQSERTMILRRRYHQTNPLQVNPARANPPATPHPQADDPQIDEAEMQAAVADAMKEYLATRTTANAAPQDPPKPTPPQPFQANLPQANLPQTNPPQTNPPQASSPLTAPQIATPKPQAAPPASAIRQAGANPNALPHRAAAYKQQLLNQSAMQRVMDQSGPQHPA